jgi:hypothetical protein
MLVEITIHNAAVNVLHHLSLTNVLFKFRWQRNRRTVLCRQASQALTLISSLRRVSVGPSNCIDR